MLASDATSDLPKPPTDAPAAVPHLADEDLCIEDITLVPIDSVVSGRVDGDASPAPFVSSRVSSILRRAESLSVDELRELVSQLWWLLPPPDRAAMRRQQYESFRLYLGSADKPTPVMPEMLRVLFLHNEVDKLYSAPRRFDLATIFVVTAAYSLLLGLLTFLEFSAAGKIITSLVITFVAVGQSLTRGIANPRGVSLLIGAVSYTLMTFVWMYADPREFYGMPPFGALLYGLIVGTILGYGAGVLVGGIFLVADKLRQRFGRNEIEESDPSGNE